MYPISLLNQAIHRRWMLFVDGENFDSSSSGICEATEHRIEERTALFV